MATSFPEQLPPPIESTATSFTDIIYDSEGHIKELNNYIDFIPPGEQLVLVDFDVLRQYHPELLPSRQMNVEQAPPTNDSFFGFRKDGILTYTLSRFFICGLANRHNTRPVQINARIGRIPVDSSVVVLKMDEATYL
jgi:hypothetical protein